MASITICSLNDDAKTRLRLRSKANGRSVEEEARVVLSEALGPEAEPENPDDSEDQGDVAMAGITIRRLPDKVKTLLRLRAAASSRSIEEEAKIILSEALGPKTKPENPADSKDQRGIATAGITICCLNDNVKTRLRLRAEASSRSMEEEARTILVEAFGPKAEPKNLADSIRECFATSGGVELELPPREPMREPPKFR